MSKYYCGFCKFYTKRDFRIQHHYKTKHNIDYDFKKGLTLKDFLKCYKNRPESMKVHIDIMKRLHENTKEISLSTGTKNINHDLHEIIFHLVYHLRNIKNIKNLNYIININENIESWTKFLVSLFTEDLNIKLNITDKNIKFYTNSIGYNHYGRRFLRHIYYHHNYLSVFKYLKELAVNKIDLKIPLKNKVLYTRKDCKTRRLINFDKIYDKFDLIIDDLNNMKIEEQISLFYNCSHLVFPNGTASANIIFMQDDSSVLDIQTRKNNSWPIKFGSYKLIKNYQTFLTKSVLDNKIKDKHRTHGTDFDIILNKELEKKINDFLNY